MHIRMRLFAITNSLARKLTEHPELADRQREYCCYIQNKVLRETRERPELYANIGAKYWDDKCGRGYPPAGRSLWPG